MKISSFFKILNEKINKYDKIATNPFTQKERIIVVWIEDDENTDIFRDFSNN